jgi:C-lobe and N-lobe beta barrels of Tf-binding protein B
MSTPAGKPASSFIRLAPLAVAALIAACGGGGGGGGTSSPTPVTLTCPVLSGGTAGYTIGGCISGSTYGSASRNENATMAFSGTQTTMSLSGALSTVAPIIFDSSATPSQLASNNTLGGVVSSRYLERQLTSSPLLTAAVGEFTNSAVTTNTGAIVPPAVPTTTAFSMQRVRFGTWEYGGSSEAYFGTWFQGNNSQLVGTSMPTTGTRNYSGILVGYLWPTNTTVSSSPLFGVSAAVTVSVNYATRAVTFTVSNPKGSQASPAVTNFDLLASLGGFAGNATYAASSVSFSSTLTASTNVNAAASTFEGQFFGDTAINPLEVAGRVAVTTNDGRRLVASFAAR